MIKNNQLLSIAEISEYVKKDKDNEEFFRFMKNFVKLNPKQAKELRKKIEELKLMKVRSEHLIKIIDLMPEDEEDLNKIFIDVSLDKDETKKVLDTVKEFK
jgi:DNA-directed RNA polymerase subunit F|tara:strand:+ start:672 stop:974 length:303 start_codon:yes stop_codon:yes gene_type:complete